VSQLPYWVQYVQALAPAVVAIIAALIAGYIAWRQYKTAHYRLCLDMFEKRFAVYKATQDLLTIALGRVLINPARWELLRRMTLRSQRVNCHVAVK